MRKLLISLSLLIPFLAFGQAITLQPRSPGTNPVSYIPFTYIGKPDGTGNLADLKATAMYVTIAQLRAFPGVLPTSNFYITDAGKEGVAIFDPTDEASSDDGVLVFVTAGSRRVKRVVGSTYQASWYGADPTGIADATTAILNAANAASSAQKDFVLGPGTYKLTPANSSSSAIVLTSKYVHWKLLGASFVQNGATNKPLIKLISCDVDIQGLKITGSETSGTYPGGLNWNAGLQLFTCDNAKITDTYINGKSVGLLIDSCTRASVKRYIFDGLFSADVVVPGAAYTGRNFHTALKILGGSNNSVETIRGKDMGSVVLVGSNALGTHVTDGYAYNFFDNGVYISSGNESVISVFKSENGQGSGVKTRGSNNSIFNCQTSGTSLGFSVTGNGNSDSYGANGSGNSIEYCTVNNVTRDGISIGLQDGYYARGTKVVGNTISNSATEDSGFGAIRGGGNFHTIHDNYIISCGGDQVIQITSLPIKSLGVKVYNNTIRGSNGGIAFLGVRRGEIYDNTLDSIRNNYAIRLSSGSDSNLVARNRTNRWFYGIYELYVKSAESNLGNYLIGNISDTKNFTYTENFFSNRNGSIEMQALPTASAYYQSQVINIPSSGSNADAAYICQRTSAGTYVWNKISLGSWQDALTVSAIATTSPTLSGVSMVIDGTANTGIQWKNSGSFRWILGRANAASESSGDLGSNLELDAYHDNGTLYKAVAKFTRANGYLGLNGVTSPSKPLHVLGFAQFDGGLIVNAPTTPAGTATVTAGGTTVTGALTTFFTTFKVGDQITANGETHTISAIANDLSMTTDAWTAAASGVAFTSNSTGIRLQVNANGDITMPKFSTAGILHNSSTGLLSSSTIATADIAANAVTYAKMQAVTTNKLLGSGSGTAVAEITLGTGLSFTGTTLNASGSGGTVTSFGKVDGFGITSSVANSTTTPVHTIAVDTSVVPTKLNTWTKAQADVRYVALQTTGPATQTGAVKLSGSIIGLSDVTASTLVATTGAYIPAPAYSSGTYKIAVINTTGSNHVETITGHLVIYTSDASTTNVSKSYLNTNYSTYLPGDVVYLPAANLKYIKMDSSSTGNWDEQPYNQTP